MITRRKSSQQLNLLRRKLRKLLNLKRMNIFVTIRKALRSLAVLHNFARCSRCSYFLNRSFKYITRIWMSIAWRTNIVLLRDSSILTKTFILEQQNPSRNSIMSTIFLFQNRITEESLLNRRFKLFCNKYAL